MTRFTRMGRPIAVIVALIALAFAGQSVLANSLHQTPPITGTQFNETIVGCSEGWHFIHTATSSSDLPSTLTATFKTAGTVTVPGYVNGNSIVRYDALVDPSDTLLSASDTIENGGLLNLSHVCVPEATWSPSSTPTIPPSVTASPTATPQETPKVTPSATPVATPTASVTPTPVPSPKATTSPSATASLPNTALGMGPTNLNGTTYWPLFILIVAVLWLIVAWIDPMSKRK